MQTIAALYVDALGPYPMLAQASPDPLDWFECWNEARDARIYDGPHPVVAHPPCKHWGRLSHLAICARCLGCGRGFRANQIAQFRSGAHECGGAVVPESDADCALRAVDQVRAFGGVLEHPAGSKLWEACGLPRPITLRELDGRCVPVGMTDEFGGHTIEIEQCEWGHVARKRTWLYLVGVPREALEAPPFPGREPTHQVSRDAKRARRNSYTLKRTGTRANLLTPIAFAEYLVRLARSVKRA